MVATFFAVIRFDRVTVVIEVVLLLGLRALYMHSRVRVVGKEFDGIKQLVTFNILADYTDAPITQVKF